MDPFLFGMAHFFQGLSWLNFQRVYNVFLKLHLPGFLHYSKNSHFMNIFTSAYGQLVVPVVAKTVILKSKGKKFLLLRRFFP